MAEAAPLESRCPRCGSAFHCGMSGGADEADPCACTTIRLAPELRAELSARFRGCLCLRCLAELSTDPSRVSCSPCTPASSA